MTDPRTYPKIPNEPVEDAANALVQATLDHVKVAKCHGHFHFFMLGDGSTLITHFIPRTYDTAENYRRAKEELDNWLDCEIERLEGGQHG